MVTWNPKANDVFLGAVELPPGEGRAAYLDEACGNDAPLREQVESLLTASARAGSFLEFPAISPPHLREGSGEGQWTIDSPPIAEGPGTVIGPYKLLQQIGEGGMGVVFMAEQETPVHRTVALKIIKPGMDTRQVIARFEAERQALAMMDHPNIAHVLDAGTTETGRPYFVMELVKGIPITKYCDEKQLSLRERIELFMPVCQAVQHAHQKGIIHRDIKPTNVLVAEYDNRAVPKIIDFGVAKATAQKLTERTMFTEFGQVIGTVEYMSPEQAKLNQLDIDTRSDIYSLGVLLYELLTGSTPFEPKRLREAAFDEVLRIIRDEEPPKPSTRLSTSETLPSIAANRHTELARLSKDLRGDLDWIVMKALEKDRSRRYDTASKFAEDVQHYLNDEAVMACPPSAAYRFRKFARRNKAAIATTSAVVFALVVGIIGTTWQAARAIRQRDRAIAAEALAEQRLETETRARKQAEAAERWASRETIRSDEFAHFMIDMLKGEGPKVAPGQDATAEDEISDETGATANRELAKSPIGGARFSATELSNAAWAVVRHPVSDPKLAEWALQMAERAFAVGGERWGIQNTLGFAYYRAGNYQAAIKTLRKARENAGRYAPAMDGFCLAMAYAKLGDREKAQRWFDACDRWVALYGAGVDVLRFREEAAESLALIVQPFVQIEVTPEERIAVYRLFVDADSDAAWAANGLAWELIAQPDCTPTDASAAANLAVQATSARPSEGKYWNTLGTTYYRMGRFSAAIDTLHHSRELNGRNLICHDGYILAMAYGERGDTEKGKSWFHATERWHRMYNIDNQLLRQYHQEAANVLDIAVAPLTKIKGTAIEWTSGLELFIAADPDASWPHAMLGQTFIGEGDWSHAAEHLLVAVRGPRVVVDSAVNSGYSLALAYLRLGDEAGYRDACATLLQATRAAEGNTWACNRAAWTCVLGPHALQDFTIPLRFAGEAVEESPQNPGYLLTLGALRYRTGVYEVAAQTLKRSIAAFADDGSGSSSVLYPKLFLMMTYWRLGRNDEARELHAECTAAINEQIASATTYWNRRLTLELISREAEALIDQNNAEQTESEPSPTDNQE